MQPGAKSLKAFTLIDLMVSMTVISILTLLLLYLFDGASETSSKGGSRIDAETQARQVFDRIAMDIRHLVRRNDVDVAFDKKTATAAAAGNDELAFYSEVRGFAEPGSPPLRRLSVVGYRMNDLLQLERGARPLAWDGMRFSPTAAPVLSSPNSLPPVDVAGETSKYEVLGDQVLRFEYGFIVSADPLATPPRPEPMLSAVPPASLGQIDAIVVTVATLDSRARRMVDADGLASLARWLPDYQQSNATAGQTIAGIWNGLAQDASQYPSGVPAAAVSSVRVYQRYFYLK
ncbi:hypothetical protein DB346_21425 [Verrucomicrobia bacterium LW23]|nr:hypothetical protein DB346_21425 [Verrucomicrobia bacterium LW23]